MTKNQRYRLDKYGRETAFVFENAGDFDEGSPGRRKATALDAEIDAMRVLAAAQISETGGRSFQIGRIADDLDDLEEYIRLIRNAAIGADDEAEGIEDLFPPLQSYSQEGILAGARAYLTNAAPHKTLLVEYDVPADFQTRIPALIDAVETAMTTADIASGSSAEATGELRDRMTRAAKLSRALGKVVTNKYRRNPAKLAAWKVASHLERTPPGDGPEAPEKPSGR